MDSEPKPRIHERQLHRPGASLTSRRTARRSQAGRIPARTVANLDGVVGRCPVSSRLLQLDLPAAVGGTRVGAAPSAIWRHHQVSARYGTRVPYLVSIASGV